MRENISSITNSLSLSTIEGVFESFHYETRSQDLSNVDSLKKKNCDKIREVSCLGGT